MSTTVDIHRPSTTQSDVGLERVGGLHVLRLRGSHREMGRQHGELLRDEVRQGPIPYYRTYIEKMAGRAGVGSAMPVVWPMLSKLLTRRVIDAFPDYARESIAGLAEGAGLDEKELLEGCALPDALLWVAARLMQVKRVGPAMHHRVALGLGCTSAIAWGDATTDGKLLHARNFDYHGIDCWPKTAAVVFHEPDDGQRYLSVSAAGVLMGGITAMNEAGLSLTVHQHMFTDRTRFGGTPIGCVGDLIMRKASSLDDAEAILRAHRPIGCWTYLITDGPRREMLCWEEDPDHQKLVKRGGEDGTFGYANIYLDPELGATERALYGSYWRHNQARYARVNKLLAERFGAHDPAGMARILGDQGEGACRISEAISMVMTVGSVVFKPEDGVVWVGQGPAPTSRRDFLPFSLARGGLDPDLDTLEGPRGDADAEDAYHAYRDAYVAYLDRDDREGAARLLRRAVALQPEQPLFHMLSGLVDMARNQPEPALAAFSEALRLGHDHPERLAAFHLWRGRAQDLAGRRDEAVVDYRWALGHHADTPIREAARKNLERPYRGGRVEIDFTFGDVMAP